MEIFRKWLLLSSMGILLLLCSTQAENPLRNVNLSPVWQWRSAWECLQNKSAACISEKDVIKMDGIVNVSRVEIRDYCDNGCANHTKNVLTCISYVHRHFKFATGANVHNISTTIDQACTSNSGILTNYKSGGTRAFQNFMVPLVASLATACIVTIFNI